jgi:hypothetical protein
MLAGLPLPSGASPALTQTPSATPSDRAHLPIIRYDASPTPPPTPLPVPYSAAALVDFTLGKPINASTFNPASIRVHNESLNGEQLVELRIDLSTAVFPDMVFDPNGNAGDTVFKDLTADIRIGLGLDGWEYEGPHGGGFDVLVINFQNFDNGDRFEFSIDIDPTSITGESAPGPHETGSVGGLELVGATVTAVFSDQTMLANQVWRAADDFGAGSSHSGAVAYLRPGLPQRPEISIPGISAPVIVNQQNQTLRVSGPPGRPIEVVVVEGGLFTAGVPGGGVDLDPFEANTALTVRTYVGVIGLGGTADIPILLSRSAPEGGINVITAAFDNHYGLKGLVAEPLVLELQL